MPINPKIDQWLNQLQILDSDWYIMDTTPRGFTLCTMPVVYPDQNCVVKSKFSANLVWILGVCCQAFKEVEETHANVIDDEEFEVPT